MKILPVSQINFNGEKKNKLKNIAGSTAIALAVAVPAQKSDAQIIHPHVYPYVTAPIVSNVPDCFVVGDMRDFDINKSMRKVFDEIDANGNRNNEISAHEVVATESQNWNLTNLMPYNALQMQRALAQFNRLSYLYNEKGSDPNTINYSEYKAIMNDYMKVRNVNNFLNLMRLFTIPYQPHHYNNRPHPNNSHRHDGPHRR